MNTFMELAKVVSFATTNIEVRGTHDEPLFLASAVGHCLGLSDVHTSLRTLPDKYKTMHTVPTPGGIQSATFVTEAGLYRLVMKSRRPEAEAFVEWIIEEVLPSIRKQGSYSVQQRAKELELEQSNLTLRIEADTVAIKFQQTEIERLQHEAELERLKLQRFAQTYPDLSEWKAWLLEETHQPLNERDTFGVGVEFMDSGAYKRGDGSCTYAKIKKDFVKWTLTLTHNKVDDWGLRLAVMKSGGTFVESGMVLGLQKSTLPFRSWKKRVRPWRY